LRFLWEEREKRRCGFEKNRKWVPAGGKGMMGKGEEGKVGSGGSVLLLLSGWLGASRLE